MKKTLEVMRYEFSSALRRKSFLFVAFGIPLLAVIIFAGINIIRSNNSDIGTSEQEQESFQYEVEGYVDKSGIISSIPEDIPDGILTAFSSENEVKEALDKGDITAYYVIPADYIETGDLIYVHPNVNPIAEGGQNWVMIWTLYFNLLGGDIEMASNVWSPANYVRRDLSIISSQDGTSPEACTTPGYTCESNALIKLLPNLIMVIIYISIVSGGSYLLRLVSNEKDSRVMELLLLSASPNQLLSGKVVSYCILGFLQVLAWLGAVYLVFKIGGATLSLPPGFSFPISLLVWGLIFFVLGYAIYATMMAGAGALTPKLSQYTSVYFIVSSPLLISYLFSIMLAMRPHSPLAVALSIFPLSAPIMMITRLTVGNVPLWQPIVAAVLSIIMAVFIIRAVARMFRAQMLLSGQPFSIQRYVKALMNSF
jgi:ABC-2 type transport system permease protein